ncbi:MAG: MBL fold metallo-hydrolase [Gemmatimonadales bacterium]
MTDVIIDVKHLGRDAYVASHLLDTPAGPVLLDPGPGSTLANLRAGLESHGLQVTDLQAVLLSHIHFDHAGAIGLLVAEHPELPVYVHERGAPHLVDPTKLLASATQVFGDKMDYLWGPFLPVPADRIRVLQGGEQVRFGSRSFEVLYTPGHASHHVTYLERATDTAYVGDIGGIRLPWLPVALPVTPPPDFSLERWLASVDAIEAWKPRRIFSTHFGFDDDLVTHFAQLRHGLHDWTEAGGRLLESPGTDAERAAAFEQHVLGSLADKASQELIDRAALFSDYKASWYGIARYHRKKAK